MTSQATQAPTTAAEDAARSAAQEPKDTRPVHVVADAEGHATLGDNDADRHLERQRAERDRREADKHRATTRTRSRSRKAQAPAPDRAPEPAPALRVTNPKVPMKTRIPILARWLTAQTKPLTLEQIAASAPPSPMSRQVASYTLPDPRLAEALSELGYQMTAADGAYTVSPLQPAAPKARAPRRPAAAR